MAFDLPSDTEIPTNTTVAAYRVERLNMRPSVTVRFAETVSIGPNELGLPGQKQVGRTYELVVDSPETLGAMLVSVAMVYGAALLTSLGLVVTEAELQTAVLATDNIDSFIATACENLEKARRNGEVVNAAVLGSAPPASPAP